MNYSCSKKILMQFKDIIGQEAVRDTLLTAVNNNRISHAQLFTGEQGTGKLALAIAFAQYISCTNRQGNDSCGECPSCKKYQKLIHPDLHFVFPVVKSGNLKNPVSDDYIDQWRGKVLDNPYFDLNEWYSCLGAENSQGMIYVSESEKIIHKLNFKTYESEYKIMIIWQPEKMNIQCANKLLKMIEEPPSRTVFLLVSDNPDSIIKTILSRTQRIKIPRIDTDTLSLSLVKKYAIEPAKAGTLARLASGSWSKACSLVETTEQDLQNLEAFKTIMRHCWSRKVLEIIEWSKELSALGRERQKSFFAILQTIIQKINKPKIPVSTAISK